MRTKGTPEVLGRKRFIGSPTCTCKTNLLDCPIHARELSEMNKKLLKKRREQGYDR